MTEGIYHFFYGTLTLQQVGLVLGLVLLVLHVVAYVRAESIQAWLTQFPRNKVAGVVLLAIAGVWSYILISEMDLGEFYTVRKYVQFILPVGFFLIVIYVDEFLSVRALGVLMMLVSSPILHAAFLKDPTSRLLLPLICYVWIIVGMFWVGMPYLMRDWIGWVTRKSSNRWRVACGAGAIYGLLMIVCAIAFY